MTLTSNASSNATSNRTLNGFIAVFWCWAIASCAGTPPAGTAAGPATIALSSHDLYAALVRWPASGRGSLAAFYAELGAMTLPNFFRYLTEHTSEGATLLDGRPVGDVKRILRTKASTFIALGATYDTVDAWWRATATKPALFPTYAAYHAALSAVLPSPSLGLQGSLQACVGLLASRSRVTIPLPIARQVQTRTRRPVSITAVHRWHDASQGDADAEQAAIDAAINRAIVLANLGAGYQSGLADQYNLAFDSGPAATAHFMSRLTQASQDRVRQGLPALELPGQVWINGDGQPLPPPQHPDDEPNPADLIYRDGGYIARGGSDWATAAGAEDDDGFCAPDPG